MSKDTAVVGKVTMQDGRVVEFSGKRFVRKEVVSLAEGLLIRFDFRTGETQSFIVNPDLLTEFAALGVIEKYGNEIAGVVYVKDMIAKLQALHTRLAEGKWSIRSDEGELAGASLTIRALKEVYPAKSVEALTTFYQSKTKEEQAALRASSTLAPVIARLREEQKGKKNPEAGNLFAGLETAE